MGKGMREGDGGTEEKGMLMKGKVGKEKGKLDWRRESGIIITV
jgi:hypothetical protein